jgi:WD40 repeat protein
MVVAGLSALVLDVKTGRKLCSLTHGSGAISSVAFSPDGTRLATGGRTSAILWDATSGEQVAALTTHSGGVSSVAFAPNGRRLLTGGRGVAKLWDIDTQRELFSFRGHSGWVTGVAFCSDGCRIATGAGDGTVRIWLGLPAKTTADEIRDWKRALYDRWLRAGSS